MSKAMEEDIGFFAVKSLMKLRFYNFSVSSFWTLITITQFEMGQEGLQDIIIESRISLSPQSRLVLIQC